MWASLWLSCDNGMRLHTQAAVGKGGAGERSEEGKQWRRGVAWVAGVLRRACACMSPVFVIYLLRYVSGVPLLDKAAEKKWGNDAKFRKYRKQVNLLVPNPYKRFTYRA